MLVEAKADVLAFGDGGKTTALTRARGEKHSPEVIAFLEECCERAEQPEGPCNVCQHMGPIGETCYGHEMSEWHKGVYGRPRS